MKTVCSKILTCLLLCLTLCFAGCKKSDPMIDMAVYFDKDKVEYSTYSGDPYNLYPLSYITTQNNEHLYKYTTIRLTEMRNYTYGLTIHYATFDIYSTQNIQMQLKFEITNISNGEYSITHSAKVFEQTILCDLKANEYTPVKVIVEGICEKGTSLDYMSYLIFTNTSTELYSNHNIDFKFQISNLKICAEHIK